MDITGVHYLRQNTQLNGRYTIYSVLGEGGFGITYFALDDLFGKRVAIKEFFPQNIVFRNGDFENSVSITSTCPAEAYYTEKKKFIKEAKAMARFQDNRGIVDVTDFFEANNTAYIVMEYLDGDTLKEYLEKMHVIRPDYLQELMKPVIRSLYGMHQAGMIHRDLSPDNIMVLKNGEIKLMDFGAARNYTSFGDRGLTVVVKHGYSPMEQYQSQGVQGPWTDIYALSAILYRCLTGQKPPSAMDRVFEDKLQSPSELGVSLPAGMEKAIMKGLQARPENRYQNLRDFCADFYGDPEYLDDYDYRANVDNGKTKEHDTKADGQLSSEGESAAVSTETEEEQKQRAIEEQKERDKLAFKRNMVRLGFGLIPGTIINEIFLPDKPKSDTQNGSDMGSEKPKKKISEEEQKKKELESVKKGYLIFFAIILAVVAWAAFMTLSNPSDYEPSSGYVSSDDSQNSDSDDSDSNDADDSGAGDTQSSDGEIVQTDDWRDGIFTMSRKNYQLPMEYSELTDDGWSYANISGNEGKDNEDTVVPAREVAGFYLEKQDCYIYVTLGNVNTVETEAKYCQVIRVSVVTNKLAPTFSIAKGITVYSSEYEIREAFGEPSETEEEEGIKTLIYTDGKSMLQYSYEAGWSMLSIVRGE